MASDLVARDVGPYEIYLTRKDGSEIPVIVRAVKDQLRRSDPQFSSPSVTSLNVNAAEKMREASL